MRFCDDGLHARLRRDRVRLRTKQQRGRRRFDGRDRLSELGLHRRRGHDCRGRRRHTGSGVHGQAGRGFCGGEFRRGFS